MIRLEVMQGPLLGKCFQTSNGGYGLLSIGKSERNELVLNDPCVSNQHARIDRTGNEYVLVDTDSTNGTHLLRAGKRLALRPGERVVLKDGDILDVGGVMLRVALTPAPDIKQLLADWRAFAEVHGQAHRQMALALLEQAAEHDRACSEYAAIDQALRRLSIGVKTRAEWVAELEGLGERLDALKKAAPKLAETEVLALDVEERSEQLRGNVSASVEKKPRSIPPPAAYALPQRLLDPELDDWLEAARRAEREAKAIEWDAAKQTRLDARRRDEDERALDAIRLVLRSSQREPFQPAWYAMSFRTRLHDFGEVDA